MPSVARRRWLDYGACCSVQGSFLGRHGSMPKQRSSSVLMGGATSRSFVFRNDDSNSALGPPKVEGSMNKVRLHSGLLWRV